LLILCIFVYAFFNLEGVFIKAYYVFLIGKYGLFFLLFLFYYILVFLLFFY